MTPDLDAIVELRKAAKEGEWYPLLLSDEDARFLRAVTSFDFAALQSRLAVLEGALREVVRLAEADDDFEGAYVDYLVPADAIDAARAALTPDPDSEERTPKRAVARPWTPPEERMSDL